MKNDPMKQDPEVSIILACYNAEKYLEDSVTQIENVMSSTRFSYELIFVDDKSRDNTVKKVHQIIKNKEHCRLFVHRKNHGRGKTVYDGLRKSKGRIIGFIDLDLDNPARYIFSMILGIEKGQADICTAMRVYKWKWGLYFLIRMILSVGYARFSSMFLQTNLKDTETGCKFFRKDAVMPILRETKDRGWFWDTEIMTRSYYSNLKILEIPTLFVRNTRVTTVDLFPETLKYVWSLVKFSKTNKELRRAWINKTRNKIY